MFADYNGRNNTNKATSIILSPTEVTVLNIIGGYLMLCSLFLNTLKKMSHKKTSFPRRDKRHIAFITTTEKDSGFSLYLNILGCNFTLGKGIFLRVVVEI